MSRASKVARELATFGQAALRASQTSGVAGQVMFAGNSSLLGLHSKQTLPQSSRGFFSAQPFSGLPRAQELLQTFSKSLASAATRSEASEKASSSQRPRLPSPKARVDPTRLLSIPGVGSKNEALFVAKGIADVSALRNYFQQECKADEEFFKDQLQGTVGIRHPQHRHFIAQHIKQSYEAEKEQKSTLEQQLTLSVEGNISAGKSTFLKGITAHCPELQDLVSVVPEPVDRWQAVGDRKFNLLDCFYKEPHRFAYTFQNYIFFTRMMQEKDSRAQAGDKPDKPYRLLERSIFCDRMVFVEALHDANFLTDMELSIYESWFDPVLSAVPTLIPDGFIYLRAKPETCLDRMHMRSRSEESTVSLDYLEQIHSKHEDWLYSLHANSAAGMDVAMQQMEQEMGRRPELHYPTKLKELASQVDAPAVPDLIKSEVQFLRKDKNPRLHGTIDQLPALVLDCEADLADLDAQKEHAAKVNQYFEYVRQNRLHRQKLQVLQRATEKKLLMPQALETSFNLFSQKEQHRIFQTLSSNGLSMSAAACP